MKNAGNKTNKCNFLISCTSLAYSQPTSDESKKLDNFSTNGEKKRGLAPRTDVPIEEEYDYAPRRRKM